MNRKKSLGVILALGLVAALLSACAPSALITPAQQTAVAATGMAAGNALLTPSVSPQNPATVTPAPSSTVAAASPAVPVTGSTAATGTSSGSTTIVMTTTPAANASSGSSGSTNGSTSGSNGSNGTSSSGNGSTAVVPNTGATSAAPTASLGTGGCQGLLTTSSSGPLATLWINNNTGTAMNFTMGIPAANSFGQCGFLTFGPINPGKTLRVRVPVTQTSLGDSCYWAFATPVNPQGRQSIVNGDNAGYCITTPTRWMMNIRSDRIRLVGG